MAVQYGGIRFMSDVFGMGMVDYILGLPDGVQISVLLFGPTVVLVALDLFA
jgi:hypothetical protein